MRKKLELIGRQYHMETFEEGVSEVEGRKVMIIDTSAMESKRKIFMRDEDEVMICEIFVPETMFVKVIYKKD